VITADTVAARERLARDDQLRLRVAAGGRRAFEAHATRRVLGERWRGLLDGDALR
jgi:hypothetical protein